MVTKILNPAEFLTVKPGKKHRMIAIKDCVYLEASTPEIEDVVRIEDDYHRGVEK